MQLMAKHGGNSQSLLTQLHMFTYYFGSKKYLFFVISNIYLFSSWDKNIKFDSVGGVENFVR